MGCWGDSRLGVQVSGQSHIIPIIHARITAQAVATQVSLLYRDG